LKRNVLEKFKNYRKFWFFASIAVAAVIFVLNPHGPYWLDWLAFLIVLLALLIPQVVQMRIIGDAEAPLDRDCDPEALARRGDEMNLSAYVEHNTMGRVETVLLHRYGIALTEVGRYEDAAQARKRIEEALAARKRPSDSASCAVMDMCLSDLCARLGDVEASRAYADQFRKGLASVPAKKRQRIDENLELVGEVTISSSWALFSPQGTDGASFDEGDLAKLEGGKGASRKRLIAEARMALASEAHDLGAADRERALLEQVAADAPKMRVDALAADILAGKADGYSSLRRIDSVDAHPAVLKDYGTRTGKRRQ
jgi:hypothetical protein